MKAVQRDNSRRLWRHKQSWASLSPLRLQYVALGGEQMKCLASRKGTALESLWDMSLSPFEGGQSVVI